MEKSATIFPEGATLEKKWGLEQPMVVVEP